ncbi:MAG: hypothetical protein ACYS76_12365 [Planctomycetota bacterium]|jgi:hypothetical protein
MGIFGNIFGRIIERILPCLPDEETAGIRLDTSVCWQAAKGKKRPEVFFQELGKLFSSSVTLWIEGTSIAQDIQSFLETRKVAKVTKVQLGTLWPRPHVYHVSCDEDTLRGLVGLAEKHAEPEICDHICVYKDQKVLLAWYDAFYDPIYISRKIPEEKVAAFCAAIGCPYREYRETHP